MSHDPAAPSIDEDGPPPRR